MKLLSKQFIITVALLAAFTFIYLSIDCQNVYAQTDNGKKTEKKAADKAVEKSAAVLVTFVEIGSVKCIPCKAMAPILEELKKEYAGKLEVEFIDVWKNPDAGKPYAIQMIPTQIFFDASGKELFRHTGFYGKDDILAKWKELGVDLAKK